MEKDVEYFRMVGNKEEEVDKAGRNTASENNIVFFCAFEKEDQKVKRNIRNMESNITPYRRYEELQMLLPFVAGENVPNYISFSSYRQRYDLEEVYEAS